MTLGLDEVSEPSSSARDEGAGEWNLVLEKTRGSGREGPGGGSLRGT